MGNRRDLVEAQTYLTASMTGAVGGLDAGQRDQDRPRLGRALLGGVLIAILAAGAAALTGFISGDPGTAVPKDGAVQVVDSGEYYVSVDGVLHPALNLTSARLVGGVPTRVHSSALRGLPRGLPIGIPGAPITLPEPQSLVGGEWTACADGTGITVLIGFQGPNGLAEDSAMAAVDPTGAIWLISRGQRYAVVEDLLTVLGISPADLIAVPAELTALLAAAEPIEMLPVPGAGTAPTADLGFSALVGDVATAEAPGGSTRYYLVLPDGLAQLSAVQYAVLSQSATASHQIDLAQAGMSPSQQPAPDRASWPRELPIVKSAPDRLCISSASPPTISSALPDTDLSPVTTVRPSGPHGLKVVIAGPAAVATSAGSFTYVDPSGLAYPVPDNDALQRLGYEPDSAAAIPAAFVRLLVKGAVLDPTRASKEVESGVSDGP